MGATFEIINKIFFVTGSLDRASDQDLAQALDKYIKNNPGVELIADMSNVRWLAPTGAKVLIQGAQEASEKGGKMRVLASRHVMQTLNLLGAKSWVTIESCLTPNPKPGAEPPQAASAPAVPEPVATPAAPAPAAPVAPVAAAPAPRQSAETPAAPAPAPVPAAQPSQTPSGMLRAVQPDDLQNLSRVTPLAGPTEELSRGALLLRVLYTNRRYNFHFGANENILGVVRERVGGPWVMIETATTRKIINLDVVEYCEIL